jgi:phosphoribosylcarboxyaminoimidazole (NCAIR) mutase
MGSTSDLGHCEKIKKACGNFGIPCELRVTSAHKGPDETLRIKAEYEGKLRITRVSKVFLSGNFDFDKRLYLLD